MREASPPESPFPPPPRNSAAAFLCNENPRFERGLRRAYSYAQNRQTLF